MKILERVGTFCFGDYTFLLDKIDVQVVKHLVSQASIPSGIIESTVTFLQGTV